MKIFYSTLVMLCFTCSLFAQCELEEIALTLNISVDNWGQETYWELVPVGNGCGNGTIAFGSNTNVGCNAVPPANEDDGYPDNQNVWEGPFCLIEGESYDLIFVDSYGDGGLSFEVHQNNLLTNVFVGQNYGNTWTIVAGQNDLPANDSPCGAIALEVNAAPIACNNENAVASAGEPSPADGPCGLPGAWCDSDSNVSNSLWYSFVAEAQTTYEITTCNDAESFDTQLALYAVTNCADYNTYELISSNDDMIGGCQISNGFASKMFAGCLTPGATYYIQLDGWQGEVGNTTLAIYTITANTTLQAYVHDINCPLDKGDEPNGAIELYVAQNGSNFTSSWVGPNGFTSTENWLGNLEPGEYTATVTDACGSDFSDSFTITLPDYWTVNITQVAPDCELSGNGIMTVTVQGASSPYEFAWTGPSNYNGVGDVIEGLNGGLYSYVITDDNNCEFAGSVSLIPANSFFFDLGADAVLCLNETEVVVGPLNCTYEWQDGSINQFYELDAATFGVGQGYAVILTATNEVGCSYSDAFIFDVEDCIAVEEYTADDFFLFPNPSQGQAIVQFAQKSNDQRIHVYASNGQLVYRHNAQNVNTLEINTTLSPGLYVVEATCGASIQKIKWLVQ
jgi:hypothetical protein